MAFINICRQCFYLVLFGLLVLPGFAATGQHFDGCLANASNATVIVPSDVASDLGDGATLAPGDEIALFTDDGTCAGMAEWADTNLAIAAAGANSQDTSGYKPDEPLQFKVWDRSTSTTYIVDASYEACESDDTLCRDDGRYATDAFYVVSRLTAHETLSEADLSLDVSSSSADAETGENITFRFILTNHGPDNASAIEVVTSSAPSGLDLVAATPSRGRFDASSGTWTLGDLAANAADTLTVTVASDQAETYAFSAEVTVSALLDPDSEPGNDLAGEDDQSSTTITASEPVECVGSTIEHGSVDRPPGEPATVTVTITNPDGLLAVNFVDADGRPALDNFTAAASGSAFSSPDGIHWQPTVGTSAPSETQFTLTQQDPGTAQAQFEAEALSVCPDPDPLVTRFDPSPIFTFDEAPLRATLQGNAPNPFRQRTTIHFKITASTDVKLDVYNVLGRKVATLVDGPLPAGDHAVQWDGLSDGGQTVASGVYLYRLEVGGIVQASRMSMIR